MNFEIFFQPSEYMLLKFLAIMLTAVTAVCAQSYGILYGGHTYGVVRPGSYGHTIPFAYSSVPGSYVHASAPITSTDNQTDCHCRPRWIGKLLCKSINDRCVCYEKWIDRDFCT